MCCFTVPSSQSKAQLLTVSVSTDLSELLDAHLKGPWDMSYPSAVLYSLQEHVLQKAESWKEAGDARMHLQEKWGHCHLIPPL